jgi:hypothetical protein
MEGFLLRLIPLRMKFCAGLAERQITDMHLRHCNGAAARTKKGGPEGPPFRVFLSEDGKKSIT